MTQAVVVRKHGDDFQGRLFWYSAALLLLPNTNVVRVAFETGPKAFDDVLIEYDPARPSVDHHGSKVIRDHLQCKWHVKPGEFGHSDLTEPAFTNATTSSFLQRAHEAQLQYAPDGTGARFTLVTNWRVAMTDPLARLITQQSNALNLDKLFEGKTAASAMGGLRKLWRDHLGIDDSALKLLARTLGISIRLESLVDLRAVINDRFGNVGMKQIPSWETPFVYDDLLPKLHAQGRVDFDQKSFREMCSEHDLLADDREERPLTIGVRSFVHPIDNLDARCDETLNLVPHFDGRYIRNEKDWNGRIAPALREFLLKAAKSNDQLRLALDAHVSLAFGVGAILNVKSGKIIEIEQRTGARRFWSPTDMPPDPAWPKVAFKEEATGNPGRDIALAAGITHDIADAVRTHTVANPTIGRILHVRLETGPSGRAIQCGRHAYMIAEQITAKVRALVGAAAPRPKVHLFIAGPNSFAFFLGQNQPAIGSIAVYEWDFEGRRNGAYSVGLEIN